MTLAKGVLLRETEPVTLAQLQAAFDDGYRFAMIRATLGLSIDAKFTQHWNAAGEVGMLRGVFHWLHPTQAGQAGYFAGVTSSKVPEMGFYVTPATSTTLAKAEAFLTATDRLIGIVHIRVAKSWLDDKGPVDWEAEGRNLSHCQHSHAEYPVLPQQYSTWDTWQYELGLPAWYGSEIWLLKFNGTVADLYYEYGAPPILIRREIEAAIARNAETAAHINNALEMLP